MSSYSSGPAYGLPAEGDQSTLNTGGGIVILAADSLVKSTNFQSTLQHELGHACGLVHVDCYGYSLASSPSIMSYNPAHHTDGMKPSQNPGGLIPEDYRVLGMNHRLFPHLQLIEARFRPPGYQMAPRPVFLRPMKIEGQDAYTGPEIVR